MIKIQCVPTVKTLLKNPSGTRKLTKRIERRKEDKEDHVKLNVLIIFVLFLYLSIFLVGAAEQQSIPIIEFEGKIIEAGKDQYSLACKDVVFTGRSYPAGATLSWYLDGIKETDAANFSVLAAWGRHNVTLIANGDLQHPNTLILYVTENAKPIIQSIEITTGIGEGEDEQIYEKEKKIKEKIYIKTAIYVPVEIVRKYKNEKDDELNVTVRGDIARVNIESHCTAKSCPTTLNFSEVGTYKFKVEDKDLCGETVTTEYEVEVFLNHPPFIKIGGDNIGTDANGVKLWSESHDDDPDDKVSKVWWVDDSKKSEGKNKTFKGSGGSNRTVDVYIVDMYGAENHTKVDIWFVRTKNKKPIASYLGTPNVVTVNQMFVLDSSNSTDDHGFATSKAFTWEINLLMNGKEVPYKKIETSEKRVSASINTTGKYILHLTAKDDGDMSEDGFPETSNPVSFKLTVVEEDIKQTKEQNRNGTTDGAGTDKRTKEEKSGISLIIWGIIIALIVIVIILILLKIFRRSKKPRKI